MRRVLNSKIYLATELLVLMVGLPLAVSTIIPIRYMIPLLWLGTLYCHLVYRAVVDLPDRIGWRWAELNRANLRRVLGRFALCTLLTCLLVLAWKPMTFLSFACSRPKFWAVVMVAYPLLSVVPQEIIFRSFFFQRYGRIFPTPALIVLASGVLFGAAHLIFQNWVAPLMCLIGGVIFAATYQRTRSLALVCIEHALYGCMIFTVGLGSYFYHGSVYSARAEPTSHACAFIGERFSGLLR